VIAAAELGRDKLPLPQIQDHGHVLTSALPKSLFVQPTFAVI
jgi:hypothetical protein